MDSKLKSAFERFEAARQDLYVFVDGLPEDILHHKKSEHVWSVIQIMNHLIESESTSTNYMVKKLKYTPTLKKAGWLAKIRYNILRLSFKLPFKYRAPRVLKNPGNELSLQETRQRWDQVRKDMRSLFESLNEEQTLAELFKHPAVGRMNIHQALSFMHAHFDRHRDQIKSRSNTQ